MSALRPPRLAEAILARVLPMESSGSILGDLREEYVTRRRGGAARVTSDLWFWAQAVAIPVRYAVAGASDWSGLGGDARVGLRQLRRDPVFAAVTAGALALGVGVNAVIFTVVSAVFLEPLPYPASDRLAVVDNDFSGSSTNGFGVSFLNMQDVEARNRVVEDMTLFLDWQDVNLSGSETPELVPANFVDHRYFDLVGHEIVRGRAFTREENRFGAGRPVAVLSHGAWTRLFGEDPDVVGRAIQLNGQPYEVVGVTAPGPADLRGRWGADTEVYLPLGAIEPLLGYSILEDRGARYLNALLRFRPDVTLVQARQDFRALSVTLGQEHPDANEGYSYNLTDLSEAFFQNHRAPAAVLLAGAGLVMLLVTVNVVNLVLVRGTGRVREMAVRRALGAGSGRLLRQLLIEGLVLGTLGGVLGVLVAGWGVGALGASEVLALPGFAHLALDGWTLAATGATTLVLGTVLGFASGLALIRGDGADALREGGRHGSGREGTRTRAVLISSEVALAFVLLVGAGLLLRSFQTLQNTGYGFDTQDLVTLHINLRGERYDAEAPRRIVAAELVDGAAGLPDVEHAFLWSPNRLGHGNWVELLTDAGRYEAFPEERVEASRHHVFPGTFRRLGIELLEGRDFTTGDDEASRQVAIVSESLARHVWPGRDPIGRRYDAFEDGELQTFEIVGVVADARHRTRLIDPFGPQLDVYRPYAQLAPRFLTIALRTRSGADAASVAGQMREVVRRIDPDLPIHDIATMAQRMRTEEARSRLQAQVVALYAALALALAALGVYGVLTHAVRRRTREIGIRMALGAGLVDVTRGVVRQGMGVAVVGAALGAGVAVVGARLLDSVLYGISPWDPAVFAGVASVLLSVAAVACALPASRAARVSPVEALREE